MDLYVERQCIDQMKAGNLAKFLLLFDAYFVDVYKYVVRRIGLQPEAEKLVSLVFIDALGQVQNTPMDIGYQIWLYSLAKPRVFDYINKHGFTGVAVLGADTADETVAQAEKMFSKMSLEEREILRLKFFEEVTDGDVMTILGIEEGTIGPKIYRVLKRAHFLLFGESDEKQGVYFGELSGLLARLRELEKIEEPVAFKLNLRADISGRIDRRDLAIELEPVEEKKGPVEPPVELKGGQVGSNDPAKIFVQAVKEMKEEERARELREQLKFEKSEQVMDFIDRWKYAIAIVPAFLIAFVGYFIIKAIYFGVDSELIARKYITNCGIEISYVGDFSDGEIRGVNAGIADRLCDHFEVQGLVLKRADDGKVEVLVDVPEYLLEYKFAYRFDFWKIKEYARISNSDKKSGKV
ncbi:hypothetical protein HY605_05535 [Candidatus Peregrinibacteria bacterium]|nr:hypothetical protein [Candidatus Peregrinibacteria bacterium]